MQYALESAFSSVVGLGALKSDHTPTDRSRWAKLISYGTLLFVCLAMIMAGFGVLWFDTSLRRSDAVGISGMLFLFGGLLAILAGIKLFQIWRNWEIGAAVYESGFAYKDANGLQQVRWQDIDAVWQTITRHSMNGIPTGTTYLYTVQTRDKKKIVLNNWLPRVEKLGTEILRRSTAELAPRYWQALQSGKQLLFGPLVVSQQGISSGNKSLRWDEIRAIRIRSGAIFVKKDRGWSSWATVGVPDVPNFFVFYELVRRFVKVE